MTWQFCPGEMKNVCPRKNLYTEAHGSIIRNTQNVETPKCPSVDEWIHRTEHTYNGILFGNKKE